MHAVVWTLAVIVAAVAGERPAQACTLEDCATGVPSTCYNLTGKHWCQVVTGYNPPYGHWTPINCYNHTRYTAVKDSWAKWNAPPNGPTNSVYLYTDNVNNSSHDADYWEASSTDWWWGSVTWPGGIGSNGCINRGAGRVDLNVYRIPSTYSTQLWLMEHETGHILGIGHVCGCSGGKIMNPCTECSTSVLTLCDGKGANALYH
jgi:hypothetical protein